MKDFLLFTPSRPSARWITIASMVIGSACLLYAGARHAFRQPQARKHEQEYGFVAKSFVSTNGVDHRYLIFIPHVPPPDSGYPVLLMLNGFGENGDDGYWQLANTGGRPIWEMQEAFPFLVVAPQCPLGDAWEREADSIALGALEQTLSDFPADRSRVFVTGVSSGGSGAMHLATQHPELFSAVVPVASSAFPPEPFVAQVSRHAIPVWVFYNQDDDASVVRSNEKLCQLLQGSGVPHRTTVYPRQGHDAWNYAYRTPELYRWLLKPTDEYPIERQQVTNPASSHSESIPKTPFASASATDFLPNVVARDHASQGMRIEWQIQSFDDDPISWTMGRVPQENRCYLEITDDQVATQTYRRIHTESPLQQSDLTYDFNLALASHFEGEQTIAGSFVPHFRLATSHQMSDTCPGLSFKDWKDFQKDPYAWARMMPEIDPRDRLCSAHSIAASLALGGLSNALLATDLEDLRLDPNTRMHSDSHGAGVGTTPLFHCIETISEDCHRRFTFTSDGRVLQVIGDVPPVPDSAEFLNESALPVMAGDTTINIRYGPQGLPIGWEVSVQEGQWTPVRWHSRAKVLNVSPIRKKPILPLTAPALSLAGPEFGADHAEFSNERTGQLGVDYVYPEESTIRHFTGLGFRLFRIPVRWERLQPKLGHALAAAEIQKLDQVIDTIHRLGGQTIIDLHNFGCYHLETSGGPLAVRIDQKRTDGSSVRTGDFVDVWQRLAMRYRSHAGVAAYGLMNEPHDFRPSKWHTISRRAVDAIRQIDRQTWLLVAGDDWSSAHRFYQVNGPSAWIDDPAKRTAYEAHCYLDEDASGKYHLSYDAELKTDPQLIRRPTNRLNPFLQWCEKNQVPGFVGEFGVPNDDPRWILLAERLIELGRDGNVGMCCWAGGHWWGDYPLSVQPTELAVHPATNAQQAANTKRLLQAMTSGRSEGPR